MRIPTSSTGSNETPVTSRTHSSSVPLSVFRDLNFELQQTQALLSTLKAQNQQLVQENQLLRQEMKKAVQAVLQLQNVVDSVDISAQHPSPQPDDIETKHLINPGRRERAYRPPTPVIPQEIDLLTTSEPLIIEEQEPSYYPHDEPMGSDFSSWRLIIAILLIIIMGFGVGYLVVRPFFVHHNRP
ncbi:hypothetical protein [Iningainema tapete]|uniref:Uncharacterized protein n=1 Tax=Iningainema tapete BLCC-T55 TaxID=2748662 RepID=A0A8J7C665_9CYAN|nr:hypothetical protein [Iningainema tapete]MBD2771631.1 hypothetical protein [Iningainema tapete BLCC-T55]